MIVVVQGHDVHKLIDRDPSMTAYPGALPLSGRQCAQELKRLVALAPKCRECLAPVAPVVLPVLGKTLRGVGMEVHLQLVVLHDRVEAHEEYLLGVAEVSDDLLRSPVLRVRTARQDGVTLVMYRRA